MGYTIEKNIQKKEHSMATKRIYYFDILNIMACLGVVWLHCSGDAFTFRLDKYWLMSLTIQVAAHWAVPIFFMLTGANLMNYRTRCSTKEYFKRRFVRIVIPFLFWSTFYFVWKCWFGEAKYTGIRDFVGLYLNNGSVYIFWFFYPLFAIYLSMPVLSVLAEEQHKKQLYYMAGLGVFVNAFMPMLPGLLGIPYYDDLKPPIIGGYVMYVLLGWILKTETFSKRVRHIVYAAGIFGAASMFVGTILLSLRDGILNELLWNYLLYPTLFMACALFLFFRYCNWKVFSNEKVRKILSKLSSASFGVYLIHIKIIDVLVQNNIVNGDSRWWMMFGAIGIYFVCVAIVFTGKKIPGIKYIFP